MIGPTSRTPLWTAEDAAAATGGRTTAPWSATGVSIDTRTLAPGDLFVALEGPNHDAHRFIPDALAKGAAAVVATALPDGTSENAPALIVEDTLTALRDLARAARRRTKARVVAVTGSVGKTGTKEALRTVLAAQGRTHAAAGSLNNHWGVPLSLARMPAETEYAVLEIGMNHPGEIAALVDIVRPDTAVITTVEATHIAHFDSLEQIADAKAEILTGIVDGGAAVLPRDNPHYERLRRHAEAAGVTRVIDFGRATSARARVLNCRLEATGSAVTAEIDGEPLTYEVPLPGEHWVMNSLAVLAAVAAVGADAASAAAALAGLEPPRMRGERHAVRLPGGVLEIIDDSYNASPVSVKAALATLGRSTPSCGGRRIAVLGDMRELGVRSAELHAELAGPLSEAHVDLVFTCGAEISALDAMLPDKQRGGHAEDAGVLAAKVADRVGPGDIVLVKGSRALRMERVVEALKALEQDDMPPRAANGA